jgi:hypothetical protein
MRTQVALLFILVLATSCLIHFRPVVSQTSPTVPEFTLILEDDSHDVVNASGTFHLEIKFIDAVINNTIPYSFYSVVNDTIVKPYYNIHIKGHSQDWKDATISGNLAPQKGNTTIKFGLGNINPDPDGWSIWLGNITNESQIDFQVRAIQGFYTQITDASPHCWRNPNFSQFNETGRSTWSNTQTITIPNESDPNSTTPRTRLFSITNFLLSVSIVIAAMVIAVLAYALFFFVKHGKPRQLHQPPM